MSEAYTYGEQGNGRRIEYNTISQYELGVYMEAVSDKLESIFLNTYRTDEIHSTFYKDDEKLCRSIDFGYLTTDSDPETQFVLDPETMNLAEYEPPIVPIINIVHISYDRYETGLIREEYVVNVDRADAGSEGNYVNRYHFTRYAANTWQATVEHTNTDIDVFPDEDYGKYYSRDMTPYDFNEFFEHSAEINTQLRMLLVQ